MPRDYPLARIAMRARVKKEEAEFSKAGRGRGPGTYTATQTGAKRLAKLKSEVKSAEDMLGSMAAGTESFERHVKTGKGFPKAKRK